MRFICAIAIAMLLCVAHVPFARADDIDNQAALICGSAPPPLSTLVSQRATSFYTIARDGLSDIPTGGTSAFRLDSSFFVYEASVVVLIRHGNETLACGLAESEKNYDLALLGLSMSDSVDVQVFSTLAAGSPDAAAWIRITNAHAPTTESAEAARCALVQAQRRERFLQHVMCLVRDQTDPGACASPAGSVSALPAELLAAWSHRETGRILATAIVENAEPSFPLRIAELDVVLNAFEDSPASVPSVHARTAGSRLLRALKRGASTVRSDAPAIRTLLESTQQYAAALDRVKSDLDAVLRLVTSWDAGDDTCRNEAKERQLVQDWTARLEAAITSLDTPLRMPSPNLLDSLRTSAHQELTTAGIEFASAKDRVTSVRRLRRWFNAPLGFRPLVAHRLPVRFRETVHRVRLGGTRSRFVARSGDGISLVVEGVPTGTDVSVRAQQAAATSTAELLLPLMKVFMHFVAGVRGDEEEAPVEPITYTGPFLNPDGIRVLGLSGVSSGQTMTLTLCAAQTCTAESPEAVRRNTIDVRTGRERWGGFAFLVDVGANFGPRAAFGAPRYLPFGEPTAGEQLYRLSYGDSLGNRFTVSMLLGVTFGPPEHPRRVFLGTGPAFIPKQDRGLRFQWDARIGVLLFPGAYVAAGVGFRQVSGPGSERIGTIRSVAEGSPAPSSNNTRDQWVPVASVGFSIDLAALGSGATTFVESLTKED